MSTEPFNLVRDVSISRFTIDVLIQRLNRRIAESITNCDVLELGSAH
jgi:hypothetical protein